MTTFTWLKLYRTIEEAQVGITASKAIFVYIRARGWKTGYYNFQQPIRQKSPLLFDIGHQCYGQLTPVKTRYPLTSIT